jgi:hypothetical protein
MSTSNRPTQLVDNNGAILPHTATDDIMNISKFGTSNIVIVGYARPGSENSEARWKIYFNTYDAAGNIVKMRLAAGDNDYAHIWSTDTAKTITAITNANPCVVTAVGHSYTTGDFVEMTGMTGSDELVSDGNGSKVYHITKLTADTFSLQSATATTTDINSTGYVAYASGGASYKKECLNYTWA